MIKKILKDVLGENFTENNEKYAKIQFYLLLFLCFWFPQLCYFSYRRR